ncbi:MAG: aldolase/citrate lyase family protein [Pseudomonadota bacterium]|nr:aldolase/citrate lyase family protein [Pseudomonadota bacterium]
MKTASHQVIELLGDTGLDFAVIDAEHAPFDRLTIDVMMVAGRAAALPLFVRLPNGDASTILTALDLGAAGLLIPHVDTPDFAAALVSRSKYINGTRGFSRSPRAGGYGSRSQDALIADGDGCMIVCQIESELGVNNVDAIARTPGVDALFIGRADLAMSMRVSATSPELSNAVHRIAQACHGAGKVLGMFVSGPAEFAAFAELGVSWCIMGSDQSMLRNGAQAGTSEFRFRYQPDRA